jgi:hypothetical protein
MLFPAIFFPGQKKLYLSRYLPAKSYITPIPASAKIYSLSVTLFSIPIDILFSNDL